MTNSSAPKLVRNSTPRATRRALEAAPREVLHRARNSTKADVYKLEWPPASGQFAVFKDMKKRPAWFRLLAGRWFLRREWLALRALRGIEGVPRALAKPDRDCVLMEWHAGKPVMNWEMGALPLESLECIAEIIARAHTRGVIHGDLHRSNILVTGDGAVTLIDWATASVFGARRWGLKKLTFAEWATLDVRAVAKLKARHAPESVSDAEKEALLNGSKIYRLVRTAGFKLRKMLGHQRTKSPEFAAARYAHMVERGKKQRDGKANREAATPPDEAVARQNESVARQDGSVARQDGAVAQRDESVERRDESVARQDGAVARQDGAVARRDGAVARRDESVARRDGETAHEAAL